MDEDKARRMRTDSKDGERLEAISRDRDWLEAISRDEGQLEAFIRDTEENWMLHAPARLQANTLAKVKKLRFSKRVQLINYSLKVCTAAAAALFLLFTMPVFLQPAIYPGILTEGPARAVPGGTDRSAAEGSGGTDRQTAEGAGRQTDSRCGDGHGDRADHSPYGRISDGVAKTKQGLQEGFQQIAGSIYDLSNEIFPGR